MDRFNVQRSRIEQYGGELDKKLDFILGKLPECVVKWDENSNKACGEIKNVAQCYIYPLCDHGFRNRKV